MNILDSITNGSFEAHCLVLDKRIDNWVEIKEKTEEVGLKVKPFVCGDGNNIMVEYDMIDTNEIPPVYNVSINYPTWFQRPNAYNAWKAHREIMLDARKKKLDYLMILEDDIVLTPDFTEILTEVVQNIPKVTKDLAMLYFGCYHNNNSIDTGFEKLRRMNGGGGFHGVLMYCEVIHNLLSFPPIGPYDWIAGTYIHPIFDCFSIHPNIIVQKDGYSFVENCNLTKPPRDKK